MPAKLSSPGAASSGSVLAKLTEIIAHGRSARLTASVYSGGRLSGPSSRTVAAGPTSLMTTRAATLVTLPGVVPPAASLPAGR